MSSAQWFMALSGRQVGPMPEQEVIANIENGTADGNTLVFTAGMTNWAPISTVPQFVPYLKGGVTPPPPSIPGGRRQAHEIDFKIFGEDMQFVEVELDPGESAVAEAGAMMYMTDGIAMETIFGDGSPSRRAGIMGALLGAGTRMLTGESLFMTVFTNNGAGKQRVAFAAPYPGKHPADGPGRARRAADLPEGLVPLRGQGRVDRHRLPEEDRRRPVRRRGLHHAEARRRRPLLRPRRRHGARARPRRRARRCASTPAASSRCSRRSTTTSSSSAG